MILDDSVSAVDSVTEKHIIDTIRKERSNKTTIWIAHRISALKHTDEIIVLHEGRIVQRGTHQELIAQEGLYAELHAIQEGATTMSRSKESSTVEPQAMKTSFRALSVYAKPHRLTFAAVILCALMGIAADLFQPYLVKIAIDDNLMIGKNDYHGLLMICLFYVGLSVSSLFFSYLQNNLLQFAGQSIVAKIRKDLFQHIFKQSMSYYDKTPSGSLITHVSSDTETLNQFFTQVLLSLVRDGMTLIFIIVLMYHLDPTLTLYSMIVIPIIAIIAISFRKYMRKTYQLSRTRLSQMVAFVAENLSGMHLIQAFHQENEQMKRFVDRNSSYFQANLREIRTNVLFNRSFDILGNLSVAFITWVGGMAVFDKTIEFGVLYAFITYIRQFFNRLIISRSNGIHSSLRLCQ